MNINDLNAFLVKPFATFKLYGATWRLQVQKGSV